METAKTGNTGITDLIDKAIRTADRTPTWTADRAGIARPTFRRKLRGGGDWTVSETARIAKALGVHPASLLPAEFIEPSQATLASAA